MEDKEIIALLEQRSERALGEADSKYGVYCKYIADSILGCREDTEECLNDTWLSLWNAIPPHRPENLKAFVGKLTRNNAIKKYAGLNAEKRREGRYALTLDEIAEVIPSGASEGTVDRVALSDAMNRFLRSISKRARIIFLRRYFYMNSICGIADDLGMRDGAVRASLSRTRERLRKFLEKEGLMP